MGDTQAHAFDATGSDGSATVPPLARSSFSTAAVAVLIACLTTSAASSGNAASFYAGQILMAI